MLPWASYNLGFAKTSRRRGSNSKELESTPSSPTTTHTGTLSNFFSKFQSRDPSSGADQGGKHGKVTLEREDKSRKKSGALVRPPHLQQPDGEIVEVSEAELRMLHRMSKQAPVEPLEGVDGSEGDDEGEEDVSDEEEDEVVPISGNKEPLIPGKKEVPSIIVTQPTQKELVISPQLRESAQERKKPAWDGSEFWLPEDGHLRMSIMSLGTAGVDTLSRVMNGDLSKEEAAKMIASMRAAAAASVAKPSSTPAAGDGGREASGGSASGKGGRGKPGTPLKPAESDSDSDSDLLLDSSDEDISDESDDEGDSEVRRKEEERRRQAQKGKAPQESRQSASRAYVTETGDDNLEQFKEELVREMERMMEEADRRMTAGIASTAGMNAASVFLSNSAFFEEKDE